MTVLGSTGVIDIPLTTISNKAWILRSPSRRGEWKKIEPSGGASVSNSKEMMALMPRDLIAAIEENRGPTWAEQNGWWTIEKVQVVNASSITGGIVTLSLENRRHRLS